MKIFFFLLLPLFFFLSLTACGDGPSSSQKLTSEVKPVKTLDLSSYSDVPPSRSLNLLFIHHSCGGLWLADKGSSTGHDCIYTTHPEGGDLRRLLEENGYRVHEASYNSAIGDKTDIHDWPSKFSQQMEAILKTDMQDKLLPDGQTNNIVMFKSCYPNNNFTSDQAVEEAMDAYKKLLPDFRRQPNVLFVAVTAPPLVLPNKSQNSLKVFLKKLLGRYKDVPVIGQRARRFNNWLKDVEHGWLSSYELKNV
ncbi:MAG: hypothetical protein KAW01_04725, partial [Deltaproteobacteria bacterium]|nr:hypothetical protein [Deltaproteobacteria bacterium]